MSTKDNFLSLKKQSFVNKSSNIDHNSQQYSNLNLNQTFKTSDQSLVSSSNSKSNTDKRFVSQNDEGKNTFHSFNKSIINDSCAKICNSLTPKGKAKKPWKNDNSFSNSSNNSSTLSLHIAAYENSVEAIIVDSVNENKSLKLKEEKKDLIEKSKFTKHNFLGAISTIQSLYEFPRQQEEKNQIVNPEIMQFKASQKLLNPKKSNVPIKKKNRKFRILPLHSASSKLYTIPEEQNESEDPPIPNPPIKKRKPRSKKIVKQEDFSPVEVTTSTTSAAASGESKSKRKKKAQDSSLYYVIECDQCGEHFESEISFFEHKNFHSFTRIALRMHIEQKRRYGKIPVPKAALSPDQEAEYLEDRKADMMEIETIDPILHCLPPEFLQDLSSSIDDEDLEKVPIVKIFNLKTKTQLTRDFKPMPKIPVIDLGDEKDNTKVTTAEE